MASKVFVGVSGMLLIVAVARMCFGSDVSIETGLYFTVEPRSTVVLRSQLALLNCSAVGVAGSKVSITWRKDGAEIVSDGAGRVTVLANGSLAIRRFCKKRIHETDKGVYECVASNDVGTIVSRQALLQCAELNNHLTGHPQSSTVTVGETVHFQCTISGVPQPTITWERNGQPLPMSERYLELSSNSLQIYNVTMDDAGFYKCRAVNIVAEKFSKAAELTVNTVGSMGDGSREQQQQQARPPRMIVGPRDQEVIVGGTVLLECAATPDGRSPMPLIRWTRKDDRPLPMERIEMLGFRNMEIRDVQEADRGVYQCTLPDWPEVAAAEATLSVVVPPHPLETSENIERPTAHTIRMTCYFDGFPTPNITWMRNGTTIKSNGRVKVKTDEPDTLLISQGTVSDSGLYQCWAQNAGGREGLIIRLFVKPSEYEPDPPVDLDAQTLSSRSIQLTWSSSVPKNGFPTMAYSVHYLPTNGGTELQKVVQDNLTVVDQLLPHTSYTFYVVAYNEKSASQHSEPIIQWTGEEVPTIAPDIRLSPAGPTSLKVEWDDLPADRARGAITRFQIVYRKHGHPSQTVIDVEGPVKEFNINDLETDVRYDVRVLAGTQVGFPSLSDDQWPWVSEIVSSTNNNIGVMRMSNVRFVVVNSTTIHVFWEVPSSTGAELLGFKISYRVQGSSEMPRLIIIDNVTDHPISELKPDTTYEIGICPFTDLGDGDFITKNVQTLPSGVVQGPPTPTAILAEPLNDTAILLTWSETEPKTVTVTHFTVRYLPVTSSDSHQKPNNDSTHLVESKMPRVVITDLSPFTVYQITVQSHSNYGHSQLSRTVQCRTKEGRPGAPLNVIVFLQTPVDIQVNWHPPTVSNGVISTYIVYYSDDELAPISQWLSQIENGTATMCVLSGLKPNTLYYIKLRAMTRRCEGQFSQTAELRTSGLYIDGRRTDGNFQRFSDRTMGIIIGICIVGACIVVCVVMIVFRKRLFPCTYRRQMMHHGSNGYVAPVHDGRHLRGNHQMSPVSITIAGSKEADDSSLLKHNDHVDSKGGPTTKKKSGKSEGEVTKANGFSIHARQNGSAARSLLGQNHSLSTEMSKMSPPYTSDPEVTPRNSSRLADDTDGHAMSCEATSKV